VPGSATGAAGSGTATVVYDAPAGSTIENVASVQFDATGDGDANDPGESVNTNTTTNTVAAVAGVQNGPNGDPDADGTGFVPSYTDPTGTTWNYSEIPSDPNDAEVITDPVYGGDTVFYKNTLTRSSRPTAPRRFPARSARWLQERSLITWLSARSPRLPPPAPAPRSPSPPPPRTTPPSATR